MQVFMFNLVLILSCFLTFLFFKKTSHKYKVRLEKIGFEDLARKIVLLIFQYCIASRVCCNRVELHCLALLLWINGYCSDMVLF